MKNLSISSLTLTLTLVIFFIFSFSPAASADGHKHFLECLSEKFDDDSSFSDVVYTKANSSYTSILQAAIWNLRFTTESTPKPQVIITPDEESQIPPVILCAKQTGLEIRTRSGGHDMEGLSSRSPVPFVIIDLINLSRVTVDADAKTAWLAAGATLGALYYHISEKSLLLGFPAGFCPTVGSGGHFSGGGDGTMVRKYGMAADNIIDARIVDASGRILDRESMGEDLFWAIRGGGGASFGVITAWKVQLVDVPETVTVFQLTKTLEQNATDLVHKWQSVAPHADENLFVGILLNRVGATVSANFFSLYLGVADNLVALMQGNFPGARPGARGLRGDELDRLRRQLRPVHLRAASRARNAGGFAVQARPESQVPENEIRLRADALTKRRNRRFVESIIRAGGGGRADRLNPTRRENGGDSGIFDSVSAQGGKLVQSRNDCILARQ
ncbi:tetrahydroberberine oxidase-like [Salvia miltiorrhiza]|uniref:tetrahydroberberine oxidase-like n=1 Tax=Salvia miltiorrhiza TaxID=226208 RepID=UPI0025AD8EFB|nr:tetrahydroberberine oxidase-like [Salvia miltiorrhiza]